MHVVQQTTLIQVPSEVVEDAEALSEALRGALNPSPADVARMATEQQEALEQRHAARHTAPWVELSFDTLAARLGWSNEYLQHLVQPYCDCGPDRDDGWYVCQHARDLGLSP